MMHTILNRNNCTHSASRTTDVKRPPKPLRHDTVTVLVGFTEGVGEDAARVVASFFGSWTNGHAELHMWSNADCSYASVRYQHATAVALAADQYVGVALAGYIHMTLGADAVDQQASDRIDQVLWQKIPWVSGDDAPFRWRMGAGKQLGADIMTAKVIQDINKEKQLLAEPTAIDINQWDTMVCDDLQGNVEPSASPSVPDTQSSVPRTDDNKLVEQPTWPTKRNVTTRTPHKTKTKGHSRTPQKTPGKVSPPNKKKKPDFRSPNK